MQVLLCRLVLSLCLAGAAIGAAQTSALPGGASIRPQPSQSDLVNRALAGDAAAQFQIGYSFDQQGNYAEALDWYGKSAAQGFAAAEAAVGSMNQMGRGVPPNPSAALKWYRLAVQQNEPVAENNLGLMYARSQGVAADSDQAITLFGKAAEQGWPPAQANLAFLYATEHLSQAYKWCVLAMAGGQQQCKQILDELAGRMHRAEIAAADDEILGWVRRQNSKPAGALTMHTSILALRLADMYSRGEGLERNDAQAAKFYQYAANQGNATAQARLGEMYFTGRGVAKDDAQAFAWFQRSAQMGNAAGQRDLGFAYLQGVGVSKDEQRGADWVGKAADQGDLVAQTFLAYCYQFGEGVPRDEQRALQLYENAAKSGNVMALNNLAWIYATSENPALRNPEKAVEYASKAAELTSQSDPRILDSLAAAYFGQAKYDAAIATEEKALALKPDDTSMRRRLVEYEQSLDTKAQPK